MRLWDRGFCVVLGLTVLFFSGCESVEESPNIAHQGEEFGMVMGEDSQSPRSVGNPLISPETMGGLDSPAVDSYGDVGVDTEGNTDGFLVGETTENSVEIMYLSPTPILTFTLDYAGVNIVHMESQFYTIVNELPDTDCDVVPCGKILGMITSFLPVEANMECIEYTCPGGWVTESWASCGIYQYEAQAIPSCTDWELLGPDRLVNIIFEPISGGGGFQIDEGEATGVTAAQVFVPIPETDEGEAIVFDVPECDDLDGDELCDNSEFCFMMSPVTDDCMMWDNLCQDSICDDDDDGDGIDDVVDDCSHGLVGWESGPDTDNDSDGCQDAGEDLDDDNDGELDVDDVCPFAADATLDVCEVCSGGDSNHEPGSDMDDCGICFGGNLDQDDCGVCFGTNSDQDECGVCYGPGAIYTCGCADIAENACDCDGNILDECGVCGGEGAILDCGCTGIPDGFCDCDGNVFDECEVCGGDGSECAPVVEDVVAADTNFDGNVNVLDIVKVVLVITSSPDLSACTHADGTLARHAADVNYDGSVNVLDIVAIVLLQGTRPVIVNSLSCVRSRARPLKNHR